MSLWDLAEVGRSRRKNDVANKDGMIYSNTGGGLWLLLKLLFLWMKGQ